MSGSHDNKKEAEKIHRILLDHLAKNYCIDKGKRNYTTWKIHFEGYREGGSNNDCSILDDFDHLKEHYGLEVGKYDALIDIFQHIDKRAVARIRRDSAKINQLLVQHESSGTYVYHVSLLFFNIEVLN